MDVAFQRKIDQTFGPLICRALSLFAGDRRPSIPPKKILVILLSEMGSLVLAASMFRKLRERYPQASVHVMVFERNREILDLLDLVPPENVLTLSDRSLGGLARDSFAVLRKMRELRFDVVIDCELFARVSSIFSFFSGAPLRVGFHRHTMEGLYRGNFINRPVLFNPYWHISEQFQALVDCIESSFVPKNKLSFSVPATDGVPRMRLREGELQAIERRLLDDFPAVTGKRVVLIYPGGGILPIRAWPLEHFCRTAKGLIDEGYAVAVIGLPADKNLASAIQEHCRSPLCIDLTGYTKTVRELLIVFHLAALLITNDGGPGQFSVMTPIGSILLFGPETPVLYGPKNPNVRIFYSGLACSPCLTAYNHRHSPCDGDNWCLKVIRPEAVLECALKLLAEKTQQ